MAIRATPFKIHDENESSFMRGIRQKDLGGETQPSTLKGAPKSARKALTTLNTNTLNSRVNNSNSKNKIDFKGPTEKKSKIQFLSPIIQETKPTVSAELNIAPEDMVCSAPYYHHWEEVPDTLETSLLQDEKYQILVACDQERENDRRMQEELDRQRAENVYLEELTKEMTEFFEADFDYFS